MEERKKQPGNAEISGGAGSSGGVRYEQTLMQEAREKMNKQDYALAARLFEDVLKKCSVTLDEAQKSLIHGELAMLYFWLGDYQTARQHADRALAFRHDNDHAYAVLGKLAIAQFQFTEAQNHFAQISEENPEKHLGYCLISIKIRDTKAAKYHLGKASSIAPASDPFYQILVSYVRLLDGEAKAAVTEARALASDVLHDPFLLLLIAEIFITAGNFGEAETIARKVLRTCPDNDQAKAFLAAAAYADEDFAQADSYAKDALRLNPLNAYAKTILMKLAVRQGSYEIALSLGEEILKQCPAYSLGHANLGDVYFNQGRYQLAEIEYDQTMNLMDAQTKGARLRQARMQFMHGQYLAAAEILEKLIESQHTYYDDAMCDLALCFDRLQDEEKKAEILEKMEMRKTFYHRTEKLLQSLTEKR